MNEAMPGKIFAPLAIIHTERLILRPLNMSDAESLFALRIDKIVNAYIDRRPPLSVTDTSEFIFHINEGIKNNDWLYWAICFTHNPSLIGTTCLWNFSEDKTIAEIGYELSPDYQGQGLMDETLKAVIHYGLNELKLNSINAFTHKNNIRSTNLLKKNGFQLNPNYRDEIEIHNVIYTLTS